jgi:hypothetical protein
LKSDISEFSYGFAVVDELINWRGLNLTAVPVYPSLYEEGQAGVGYDVRLDTPHLPLFLQFKLAHCMVRRNASEYQQGLLNVPFYRMRLRPSYYSNQHQSLLDLESDGNVVYYVAPFFHLPDEFNTHYLNRQICTNSIFVRPNNIGPLPDNNYHHVSYENTSFGYFCSEPKEMESPINWETFISEIDERWSSKERLFTQGDYQDLAKRMIGIISEWKIRKPVDFRELPLKLSPLRQVAYLARTFFDCEFLMVTQKKDKN